MRDIMALADAINGFFDLRKPWLLAKSDDPERPRCTHRVCTQTLECFRVLTIYLKPVLPALAADAETFLGLPPQHVGRRRRAARAGRRRRVRTGT